MIRGKNIIWLSMLVALCVSAFAASNASAAGTALGTCNNTTAPVRDFSDAHCNVSNSEGPFGHTLFPTSDPVITITGKNTPTTGSAPFKLEGKLAGVTIVISCSTVEASGSAANLAGNLVSFGTATTNFTGCVQEAPAACAGKPVTVAKTTSAETDPMNLRISTTKKVGPTGEEITFHEENAAGTEMGIKFAPTAAGGNFTEITVECPTKVTAPVKGFTYATPARANGSKSTTAGSGAELVFSKSSSIGGLTFAGNPATLEGTLTLSGESKSVAKNPLILTTR